MEHKVELQDRLKGKTRGAYKARIRVADGMRLSSVRDDCVEFKGEMYLKLASGNLLPRVGDDMYNWFGSAIVPKEWIRRSGAMA